MMASPAERSKLIFPENWNLSEIQKLPSTRKADRPSVVEVDPRINRS